MSGSQLYIHVYIYICILYTLGLPWIILKSPETPEEPVEPTGELQGAPESFWELSEEVWVAPWGVP